MPLIHSHGSPSSRLWVVFRRPFPTDVTKGYLCSGGMGYAFHKILTDAGFQLSDCYFCSQFPDTDQPMGAIIPAFHQYKPPVILVVGEAGIAYCDELRPFGKQNTYKTQLNKYVGSLLKSSQFNWDHWIIPLKDPQDLMIDWSEREVTCYIDCAKAKDELAHWKKHGTVQPLKSRTLLSHEMADDELLNYLDKFRSSPFLAEDIETIYPKKGSPYFKVLPGVPITFGIATSPDFGISFNLFRKTPSATREVWRAFDKLHYGDATIIGQNFFIFDSLFYNMMGLHLRREKFQDTLIRQHILWPELPKSLQFLTRQYTRQPYYKDEGKSWSLKQLDSLRQYNCLDVTVDFEVYLGQEEEFDKRPHLREGVAA
jgi:hypothetical protein